MRSGRSLQAILFTDIVGSTERATELGDRGWSQLLQEHHNRARREIRRFGGREIKSLGDGFLASFPRPSQAIRCAWSIREATKELGLEVRAGIHVAEVEQKGSDLGGIAVHICSRILAQAAPGEILVSNAVREMETGSGFRFQDRGKHELKGVSAEWRLFALESLPAGSALRTGRWIPELTTRQVRIGLVSILTVLLVTVGVLAIRGGSRTSTSSDSQALASAAPAIAILPFRVRGEQTEVLREGMVDLLSTGINEASGVRAINPATLFARWGEVATDDQEPDLSTLLEIARRTGSRYAVVGAAIAVGAGVRLSASVYDLRTTELLGQGQVEGPQDTILQMVDHLTVDILRVVLERGEEELPEINLSSLTTDSPEALRAYLEGEVHFRHFDLQAAEEAFKQAIEADSMFALAYYRLADTYVWPTNFGGNPGELLERAVALSDRLPAEERVLVKARHASLQRSPEAIESLREVVQRHPENAEAWYQLADSYLHVSSAFATAEEISGMFKRAVELDPKNAKYLLHHAQFAWWHKPDRTAAGRRIRMWEQVAPRHPLGPAGRLAVPLAFGDSITQESAVSRLRSETEFEVVNDVLRLLYHPRYPLLQEVLRELQRHVDEGDRYLLSLLFRYYALWRGQLQEGLAHVPPGYGATDLYEAWFAGLSAVEKQLEAVAIIDTMARDYQVVVGGILAADRARWSDHSRAIAELKKREKRAIEASNPSSEWYRQSIGILEAHRSWRRGEPSAALPTLSDPEVLWNWTERRMSTPLARWWLARAYRDAGRLEDAERVYQSFHFLTALSIEPLAQYELGKIYEELGRHEEAVKSYEYFIDQWKNADPELQPMVDHARQAAIRIRGLQRE